MAEESRKPSWFDNKISLGNMVTWGVMLCGLAASYTQTQADVRILERNNLRLEEELKELKRDQRLDREAILDMKGDVRAMKQDVHYIRQAVDASARRP